VRQTIQGVTGTPGSPAQPGQQPSTGPTSTPGSAAQPGQQPSTGPTGTPGSAAQPGQQPSTGPTGTLGSAAQPGQQPSTGPTSTLGSAAQPGQQPSTGPTSILGSGRQPVQQPSTGTTSPKTQAGGTDTEDQEHAGLVPAHPNPVAAVPNVVASVTNAVAPATDVVAPVTDVIAPVSDVIAPGQYMPTVAGAVVGLTQPPSDLSSFLLGIAGVAPVTDVVAPLTNAVVAPVFDVIAPGQYMPTVAGAVVPLTQPPSDLSSLLLGIAGVAPVGDGTGGIHRPGLAAAAGGSGASPAPLVLPFAGVSGVPVAGNAPRVATLDVTLLGRVSALSGMAPQAPNSAFPMGAESFFPHVGFNELLLIASLWALAAVALPGVGGLVILTVVGVRIQYGRLTGDSRREHRAFRDSPIPRAVKRWMSAR
jgi:hypothetical protein